MNRQSKPRKELVAIKQLRNQYFSSETVPSVLLFLSSVFWIASLKYINMSCFADIYYLLYIDSTLFQVYGTICHISYHKAYLLNSILTILHLLYKEILAFNLISFIYPFYFNSIKLWMNEGRIEINTSPIQIETNFTVFFVYSCCSWWASKEAEREAENKMIKNRTRQQTYGDDLLLPQGNNIGWGNPTHLYSKESLIEMVTGKDLLSKRSRRVGKDRTLMDEFLRHVPSAMIPMVPTKREGFNPVVVPLLDYLAVDVRRSDSWSYPSRQYVSFLQNHRGLSMDLLRKVEVREIVVGESSRDDILSALHWFWGNYQQNQNELPTSVVSCDVEETKSTYFDFLKICGLLTTESEEVVLSRSLSSERVLGRTKDSWYQIPSRIMLGDGLTWSLQILIPVEERRFKTGDRISYLKVVQKMTVQPEIVDFLQSLPTLVGVGIRSDITGIEEAYSLLAGVNVTLPSFIELGALAVLLGWTLPTNMPVLAAVTSGLVLNKMVSEGDRLWGSRWEQIAPSLQVYALGDLLMGYVTYVVLFSILIRDFFPDRDSVALLGKCTEFPFIDWLARFTKETLAGLELSPTAIAEAETRAEIISCLRYRTVEGKISDVAPSRLLIFINLLGGWPALPQGGPRFLHQVRAHTLKQFSALSNYSPTREEPFFSKETCTLTEEILSFGRENLSEMDWEVSPREELLGLLLHPEMEERLPGLVISELLAAKKTFPALEVLGNCQRRLRLLEWLRFHPWMWKDLVLLMSSREHYRRIFAPYYEPLRLGYVRVSGDFDAKVEILEEEIATRNAALLCSLEEGVRAARAELELREQRYSEVLSLRNQGLMVNRRGWEHVIQTTTKRPIKFIPRDRPRIVLGKRARVDSTDKVSVKRVCVDPALKDPARRTRMFSQPTTGRVPEDPVLPLGRDEHPSRGKVAGKLTQKKKDRADMLEKKISGTKDEDDENLVLLLDADEYDWSDD